MGHPIDDSIGRCGRVDALVEALLVSSPFPDLAFGHRIHRRPVDLAVRSCEVLSAYLRRRNPPPPPWRRREIARWVRTGSGPGPSAASARPEPLLLAVIAAWNEDDIIFATVRNLLAEGIDRVLVIDDDSDDDTRSEAEQAGASVVRRRSDGRYSEEARAASIRELVATTTAAEGGDVWWLVVDADELPRGPGGTTVRELVRSLPPWVDVVGSYVLDHVPHSGSRYEPRDHPVTAFPLARPYANPYCGQGHWKHQLLRVRNAGDLAPLAGQHVALTGDGRQAREPVAALLMHHFPLRGKERTAAKFMRASYPGGRYARSPDAFTRTRLLHRIAELEAHYADAPHLVPNPFPGQRRNAVGVRPWQELVGEADRHWPSASLD